MHCTQHTSFCLISEYNLTCWEGIVVNEAQFFEINCSAKNYDENRQNVKHLSSLHKLEPSKSAESKNAQKLKIVQ